MAAAGRRARGAGPGWRCRGFWAVRVMVRVAAFRGRSSRMLIICGGAQRTLRRLLQRRCWSNGGAGSSAWARRSRGAAGGSRRRGLAGLGRCSGRQSLGLRVTAGARRLLAGLESGAQLLRMARRLRGGTAGGPGRHHRQLLSRGQGPWAAAGTAATRWPSGQSRWRRGGLAATVPGRAHRSTSAQRRPPLRWRPCLPSHSNAS